MAEILTPQQNMAVNNRGGKLLVSAAAGSGKTKVLVDRLLSYVMDNADPANLDDFLIITYTKAAAAELRGKISKKLIECIAQDPTNRHLQQQMQRLYLAKISTVHSFCGDILREYAYKLDIPADFRVGDETECGQLQIQALEQVLANAYDSANNNPYFCSFVDTQGFGRDDRQVPEIILKVYQSAMCHIDPNAWLEDCLTAGDVSNLTDAAQTVWGQYLLDEFRYCLNLHIAALENCITKASHADGFEKPCTLLANTVSQLRVLAGFDTWDAVASYGSVDYGRLTFSKKCTDLQLVDQIKAVRGACKSAIEKKLAWFSDSSQNVLQDLQSTSYAIRGLVELVMDFSREYAKRKHSRRILDFSDLEHRTLDLLLGKNRSTLTSAAREISQRYREIMVDEYQDSNGVQDAIFSVLTQNRNNCFMVGDVKQSIYQFRLADPDIFIKKYNEYHPAETAEAGEGRKVLLSSNFRSSQGIISAVNFVFSKCMSERVGGLEYGPDEMLREGVNHIPLGEPETEFYGIDVKEDTYAQEAGFVAERISQLLDGSHYVREADQLRPITPGDIVILLRSPGSVGGEFRYALSQRGIPVSSSDASVLLHAPEIVTLISLLQVIDNPLQDIPLISVLLSPVFAFTANEIAKIRSKNKRSSVYDALINDNSEKAKGFVHTLDMLRSDARMDSVNELLLHIFSRTKWMQVYSAMPDGASHSDNLHTFFKTVTDFENTGRRSLQYFLEYLTALEARGIQASGSNNSDGVTIMSIHKSKGLEFPVVFLCGLSRRFNEESARGQVLSHKEMGLGLNCVNQRQRVRYPTLAKRAIAAKILSQGLSEEMRVLYVAMTRARDRLIMTYAVKNLESDLMDIAMRMECSPVELLTTSVSCPGEWVLLAAMSRVEAGELFALGGNPGIAVLHEPVWRIGVSHSAEFSISSADQEQERTCLSQRELENIKKGLSFRYPHQIATKLPSKQTATQLKGRLKDTEISQGTSQEFGFGFRRATFSKSSESGKEYGTVMHLVMQHIRYDRCSDVNAVRNEVERLLSEGILTQEQAICVDCNQITSFFQTELGQMMAAQPHVLREFKFSVLIDADKYYSGATGEKILLQGVVDCAIETAEGMILVDFKTDRVAEETVNSVAARYKMQVLSYTDALEEVFEKKVIASYLYFFRLGKFISISR